jgi:hypothetical protein
MHKGKLKISIYKNLAKILRKIKISHNKSNKIYCKNKNHWVTPMKIRIMMMNIKNKNNNRNKTLLLICRFIGSQIIFSNWILKNNKIWIKNRAKNYNWNKFPQNLKTKIKMIKISIHNRQN